MQILFFRKTGKKKAAPKSAAPVSREKADEVDFEKKLEESLKDL